MDLPDNCPVCKTKWTRTPRVVTTDVWVHCKPCGSKAEDIMKKHKEPKINPHATPSKYSGTKYDKEEWSSYDTSYFDDDFGLFTD